MKSIYKRILVVGLSLSLIALAGLQGLKEKEIEGDTGDDEPDGEKKLGPVPVPDCGRRTDQVQRMLTPVQSFPSATRVTFSGKLVRNGASFALLEMGGDLYTLDSIGRPLPPLGQNIRVTGMLDLNRCLLHVEDIEPFFDLPRFMPRAAS